MSWPRETGGVSRTLRDSWNPVPTMRHLGTTTVSMNPNKDSRNHGACMEQEFSGFHLSRLRELRQSSRPSKDAQTETKCPPPFAIPLQLPRFFWGIRSRRMCARPRFNSADRSVSCVARWTGSPPDSRPSHWFNSAGVVETNRPSRFTGMPSFAQR